MIGHYLADYPAIGGLLTSIDEIVPWLLAGAVTSAILVLIAGFARRGQGGRELKGLDPSWSFTESWASNVTVGSTALLAVLASSEVATTVLGDRGSRALGVVLVASAVSTALVGLAPLVIKAFVAQSGSTHAAGLGIASFLTLTGVGLEIGVATTSADRIYGGGKPYLMLSGLVVTGVVAVYAFRTLNDLFGRTDPPPSEQSDTMKAAVIVANAILQNGLDVVSVEAPPAEPKRRMSAIL